VTTQQHQGKPLELSHFTETELLHRTKSDRDIEST